ncbi:MAG: nitroreductase family deazaflavin-dependent oxidoreductase [Chloroflexi bacterium]|nr:nitroreductase family deazaflavin-dependent oxidoreductase [Chloroflexota bacterium]
MTNDRNAYNESIVKEFRENAGKVGGRFEGFTLLLLHTTGAKSGEERINPLMLQDLGDGWAVFASKGGATTHPDWYYNVRANPDLTIELGTETIPVRAHIAEGEEREQIWTKQKTTVPTFAKYEETAGDREIPVVVLKRR